LILRVFNHVGGGSLRWVDGERQQGLLFPKGTVCYLSALAGGDVNQGAFPMTFVGPLLSRLSVVTAYVAFAFVGAIVLGVF
jgi:hypothetical protein